jgi:hypothetical protein
LRPIITSTNVPGGGDEVPNIDSNSLPDPLQTEEIRILVERVARGDMTALPALSEYLDDCPQLWRQAGDLAWHTEQAHLRLIAGPRTFLFAAANKKLQAIKAELAGAGQVSPVERLVIDRVRVCWLHLHTAELDAAEARAKDGSMSSLSVHAQRCLDSAHRRNLMALKQLALIRRLLSRGKVQNKTGGRSKSTNSK